MINFSLILFLAGLPVRAGPVGPAFFLSRTKASYSSTVKAPTKKRLPQADHQLQDQ